MPLPAGRQRREPRGRPRLAAERELRGSDVRDVSDDYALLAVQGPRALERLGLAHAPGVHLGDGRARRGRGDGQPHGLHGRGGRRARLHARGRAGALGRDPRPRRRPCGLGARDTLRLEVCYPLHGNDIGPAVGRDLERARLGLRARDGVHRRRGAARGRRRRAPSGSSSRSR